MQKKMWKNATQIAFTCIFVDVYTHSRVDFRKIRFVKHCKWKALTNVAHDIYGCKAKVCCKTKYVKTIWFGLFRNDWLLENTLGRCSKGDSIYFLCLYIYKWHGPFRIESKFMCTQIYIKYNTRMQSLWHENAAIQNESIICIPFVNNVVAPLSFLLCHTFPFSYIETDSKWCEFFMIYFRLAKLRSKIPLAFEAFGFRMGKTAN